MASEGQSRELAKLELAIDRGEAGELGRRGGRRCRCRCHPDAAESTPGIETEDKKKEEEKEGSFAVTLALREFQSVEENGRDLILTCS